MWFHSSANLAHNDPVVVVNTSIVSDEAGHFLRQFHLNGECVVSYSGTSQYADGAGVSACGIAALNCVRVLFSKERHRDGRRDNGLLKEIMSCDAIDEITSICAQWSSQSHLEVEDIYQTPIFETSLKLLRSRYSKPCYQSFEQLLLELQRIDASASAVITRPPEIITCLKLVISNQPLFIIFDSHPRPNHPNGAALIFHTSINATASYLVELLAVDDSLLSDTGMQWQTQLLANFCAHIFVSRDPSSDSDLTHAMLQSSLTILSLRNQLAELAFQNKTLTTENRRLENEAEEADARHVQQLNQLQQELASRKSFRSSPPSTSVRTTSRELSYSLSQPPIASTSRSVIEPDANYRQTTTVDKRKVKSKLEFEWLDPEILLQQEEDSKRSSMDRHQRQLGFDAECSVPKRDSYLQNSTTAIKGKMKSPMTCDWIVPDILPDCRVDQNERLSANLAAQKQREFEAEDAALRKEREDLARFEQRRFVCGICLEEHPEDFVARVEPCRHAFCRHCIKGHITSWIMDHRYPIFCPICMAGKANREPATLDFMFIQQVGVSEKDFAIYEELQMAMFSVLIHCRKCQQSVFVDRDEHQTERLLVCPLPGCNYIWCKACQQEITVGGPQHSCDGSSELNHLMKKQGWKHCPGCQTPIQKDSGCNHMTCMSPGCNTHFCYTCGDSIVRSSLRQEIKDAVSAHYRICVLFSSAELV